jgi:hypothetical protein
MTATPSAPPSPTHKPAFVLTYGPSKLGKTTDLLYSLPRSLFIGTPAAFKSSEGIVGFTLHQSQVVQATRVSDATALIKKLGGDFDAGVVDDFSLLAETTLNLLEKKFSGFKLWAALNDEILEFRDTARACAKHVIVNCHENPPKQKNGMTIRGGPQLPSYLPERMPAQCDLVLRAFHEPSRKGPWPVVYRCTPTDPNYITGDRHGVTPDMAPLNIGEILRAAGFKLRRAPGLDWIENVVAACAEKFYEFTKLRVAHAANPVALQQIEQMDRQFRIDAITRMREKFTQNDLHIRWALRDSLDRATLRASRDNALAGFFT